MAYYYINENQQPNGDHEIHTTGCPHPPLMENRIEIGNYTNSHQALAAARARWPKSQINGCAYCCPEINTD